MRGCALWPIIFYFPAVATSSAEMKDEGGGAPYALQYRAPTAAVLYYTVPGYGTCTSTKILEYCRPAIDLLSTISVLIPVLQYAYTTRAVLYCVCQSP
jgi:hypothetical protein